MKEGTGKYTYSDGSTYDGDWYQNKIDGLGTQIWSDGKEYYGQWEKNYMHGYGFYVYADKMKYDGQFESDKKHGYGIYSWTDGRRYAGYWNKGKQHGFGVYTGNYKNNTVKYGIWDNGKRIKWFDEATVKEIQDGKYDYKHHFKDQEALEALLENCSFEKPDGWEENMDEVRTLLNVPQ